MSELEQIKARLQALEDIQAITELLYSYPHHIDRGETAELVALFTPDARFRARVKLPSGPFDKDMIDITGHEALEAFGARIFKANSTPPAEGQVNIVSQPVIALDGDRATAKTYQTIVKGTAGERELTSFGRYQDVVVRCDDGRWRFQDRISEVEHKK